MFGDGDGSRDVTLLDFALFRSSFGSLAGSETYNEAFDHNLDDEIELTDFAKFRSNFGRSLPQ